MPLNQNKEKFAVIFDCDGVLLDSEPLGLESLYLTVKKFGFPYQPDELTRFCGITDSESLNIMMEENGININSNDFLTTKRNLYLELMETKGVKLFDGVKELLHQLKENGFLIAVASSAPRQKLHAGLKKTGIMELFNIVVCGDDVKRGKPAPDIFLVAAQKLECSPSSCVVIEDTPVGVEAGCKAGMKTIAVAHTFPPSILERNGTLVIQHISQINLDLILQHLKPNKCD